MQYTLLILLLPFLTFLFLGLMDSRLKPKISGIIGTVSLGVITALSYICAFQYFFGIGRGASGAFEPIVMKTTWLRFIPPVGGQEGLQIDLGVLLDPISVMMLVVITTVSLMVHIYSNGYMHGEKGFQRYFAFLSLFTFSMLGLVVATNIFQMYIFWELVGVSSYLLIGFYYTKPEAVRASKKAFIVTRFADMFFLIGILLLSFFTKTFDFQTLTAGGESVFASASGLTFMGGSVLAWALGLIFIGGAGKSAMFPLHVWLPDAMEGPTPVSALIHAATMVVAGVYLVARLFFVYVEYAPEVLFGIAVVGAFTALYAAIVACTQTDIKRVLAFSTISQIGFMMVALGVSEYEGHHGLGYMASMFHLFTHAMFKAGLFLGAGSIIHAVHSNEMSAMGGLRKYMPITHITFAIFCLAIAGIPLFSGFWSKDEILTAAFEKNIWVGITMSFTAGLTAFYMFRLYYNIFWGKKHEVHHEHIPHESPISMTFPLIFFAVVTLTAGWLPFGKFVTADGQPYTIHLNTQIAIMSVLIALVGIGIASFMYLKPKALPDKIAEKVPNFYRAASNRFYIDNIYLFITKKVIFRCVSTPIAWFDRHVIDGAMNGLATVSNSASVKIKGLQSGRVQQYALVFLWGVIIATIVALITLAKR
ncbi:MAG: NADH-quinone oxidoreductase subunit L [Prevotellaceae bacterium]|jgi:NADH-quinone oxidoreductase subunit L|nr:NADH-quinone oxidoreductase subunit L [Prevotellaceae bacterium]